MYQRNVKMVSSSKGVFNLIGKLFGKLEIYTCGLLLEYMCQRFLMNKKFYSFNYIIRKGRRKKP